MNMDSPKLLFCTSIFLVYSQINRRIRFRYIRFCERHTILHVRSHHNIAPMRKTLNVPSNARTPVFILANLKKSLKALHSRNLVSFFTDRPRFYAI